MYAATPCSDATRIGSCAVYVGQPSAQIVRYYASGFETTTAQAACTGQSGAFTPN